MMTFLMVLFVLLSVYGWRTAHNPEDRRTFRWLSGGGFIMLVAFVVVLITGCTPKY